jgi:hypothetical protein
MEQTAVDDFRAGADCRLPSTLHTAHARGCAPMRPPPQDVDTINSRPPRAVQEKTRRGNIISIIINLVRDGCTERFVVLYAETERREAPIGAVPPKRPHGGHAFAALRAPGRQRRAAPAAAPARQNPISQVPDPSGRRDGTQRNPTNASRPRIFAAPRPAGRVRLPAAPRRAPPPVLFYNPVRGREGTRGRRRASSSRSSAAVETSGSRPQAHHPTQTPPHHTPENRRAARLVHEPRNPGLRRASVGGPP